MSLKVECRRMIPGCACPPLPDLDDLSLGARLCLRLRPLLGPAVSGVCSISISALLPSPFAGVRVDSRLRPSLFSSCTGEGAVDLSASTGEVVTFSSDLSGTLSGGSADRLGRLPAKAELLNVGEIDPLEPVDAVSLVMTDSL